MNDVLDGNRKEQFYNSKFNLAFFDIFRPPKEWTDQNDVDITVDVELQREEFYRIKNHQRHFSSFQEQKESKN